MKLFLRKVFGLDLGDDGHMPKVDSANRIQEFMLGDKFQATFDAWAAEVEKKHGGKLEITHEEVVLNGTRLMVFWRVTPNPAFGRRR